MDVRAERMAASLAGKISSPLRRRSTRLSAVMAAAVCACTVAANVAPSTGTSGSARGGDDRPHAVTSTQATARGRIPCRAGRSVSALAPRDALAAAIELHGAAAQRHVHRGALHEVDELPGLRAGDDLAALRRPLVDV